MSRMPVNYQMILQSKSRPRFKSADLPEKTRKAYECLRECELCSRSCRIDRTGADTGYCKVGAKMSISSAFDHYGEEPFLVPSFTVFFRSCTFACQFCQNWEISRTDDAADCCHVSAEQLARAIDAHGYCRNVNFVGGEPTPYLPFILETLNLVESDIPVVWNSNFYMSQTSVQLLRGVVDLYLSDLKYGNDRCALRLSDAPGYSDVVRRNHLAARQDADLVIRHLILPNHLECCTIPVLDFISLNLGDSVIVNLMDQYRPCYRAGEHQDIARRITAEEFERAVHYAKQKRLNYIT